MSKRDWKKATRKAENVVIFSPHISCEGKCIYNIIIGFSGKLNGKTYTPQIPINELTQYSGLSKKKIISATNELVDLGLITKHQVLNQAGKPSVNQYEVLPITEPIYERLTQPFAEQKQKPRGITSTPEEPTIDNKIKKLNIMSR